MISCPISFFEMDLTKTFVPKSKIENNKEERTKISAAKKNYCLDSQSVKSSARLYSPS